VIIGRLIPVGTGFRVDGEGEAGLPEVAAEAPAAAVSVDESDKTE